MTWVVPLALGGFAILLMAFFTVLGARKRHGQQVAPALTVGPRVLVHDINDDRCTGCDACVAVCPTNVLDLVANKSRVLRFQDCIQCEACMIACPTEALVMFPEGSVPPPLKVPEMDENFQTAVPGQYLIGEVAGKPLVKSAANLGRAVIEHMVMTGLRPGALAAAMGNAPNVVDVVIVGSGPGGLSAGLSCIQRGLSYVVLEKEQSIASTISRYPKGKLVMAEPYDTQNLSFLPVFDSGKEQLIPIWEELLQRVQLVVKQGESVETVTKQADGTFEVRSTVAAYRAQRVVLSIGTRGKPRTLQVPGENLPKVYSLLEDPDEWRGRNVLVVGGGDSAVEAALALSEAGAKVMISYRGKGFNRAAPKNKQTIEQYASEGRLKAKLGSQVLGFEPDSVTLALADGSQKRYANDVAFVLIGADPPIAWLEKVGIRFVERPHQHQLGKTDDIVRRFIPRAAECTEDAARAAAAILGGSTGFEPSKQPAYAGAPPPMGSEQVSGPRKWLRSATSIFSNKAGTNPGVPMNARANPQPPKGKKLDAPMPLSKLVEQQKAPGPTGGFSISPSTGVHHGHTGHGRRDQLSAGERTRILRMLRDEGGRLADEDSQVYIGAAPPKGYDFDFDDGPAPAPAPAPNVARPMNGPLSPTVPAPRADVPAKPAQISGLAAAQAKSRRDKRTMPPPAPTAPPVHWGSSGSEHPTEHLQPHHRNQMAPDHLPPDQFDVGTPPMTLPPEQLAPELAPPSRNRPTAAPPRARNESVAPKRPVPSPFGDEPTRQVNDHMRDAVRRVAEGVDRGAADRRRGDAARPRRRRSGGHRRTDHVRSAGPRTCAATATESGPARRGGQRRGDADGPHRQPRVARSQTTTTSAHDSHGRPSADKAQDAASWQRRTHPGGRHPERSPRDVRHRLGH
ncbi:MAG: NAD(P)-binding domain-containing protein [Proteobacteria bacterium]|nr:NAD(P)-binding domain-containing protein [Pseudomonadota bacterium]